MTTGTNNTAIVNRSNEPLVTETAGRAISPAEWKMITEQSVTLEQAGKGTAILPKGIANRYQIAAILLKGHELGLAPMYSLEQIAMVNGKAVVQGQALVAIIQRAHGGEAITVLETTDERCVIGFRRRDSTRTAQMEWTIEMAKRAGLLDKSGPWKQYPRTMLRWRCIAEGARIHFADTIAGLYLPDELGVAARVTTDGDLVFDGEITDHAGPASDVTVRETVPTAPAAQQVPRTNDEWSGPAVDTEPDLRQQVNEAINALADATNQPLTELVPIVMADAGIKGKNGKTMTDEERQRVLDVIQTRLDSLALSNDAPVAEATPAEEERF